MASPKMREGRMATGILNIEHNFDDFAVSDITPVAARGDILAVSIRNDVSKFGFDRLIALRFLSARGEIRCINERAYRHCDSSQP
jgi:hypothetical protein